MPKVSLQDLSSSDARFLLELQRLIEEGESPGTVQLARRLGVRPPTVSEVLKRLEGKGMVRRTGWGRFELTARGRRAAETLLHNHRVIESYFVIAFGLDVEYACREASKIGHLVGERVVASMCRSLNWPDRCVHGKEVIHWSCR
ncbi:MAG: metal-dependent transcriptional regulator [Nitrososphaerota archaeon]|nr:metal-dependent transcriptional regulator [Candidatus Calditenuis fumarioli]